MRDDELTAAIREVRDRVRARHPEGSLGLDGVAAPDLMPLVHARDAAEAKVAAIGTVNPRPPGLKNSIVQFVKKTDRARARLARAGAGGVQSRRDRAACRPTLEAITEVNRALAALAAHIETMQRAKISPDCAGKRRS